MTTDQHRITSILLILQVTGEVGIQETHLLPRLRLEFRELTAPQLSAELRALADKQWVIEQDGALGTKRWRITGRGTSQLQEAGLA